MSRPCQPWDIVVVPFPYSDSGGEKRRPALIVSSNTLHEGHAMYWVAMITTAKRTHMEGDIAIGNPKQAGLLSPSVIRPAKLTTVEQSRILRAIGTIAVKERERVKQFVRNHLAV